MARRSRQSGPDTALDECACFKLRRAARAVTQLYDSALRGAGLRTTQFSILGMLYGLSPLCMHELAERLGADRTTLTRNLRPLERDGLVIVRPGLDRRVREVEITAAGREAIRRAVPLWRNVQQEMRAKLGADRLHETFDLLDQVTDAALD